MTRLSLDHLVCLGPPTTPPLLQSLPSLEHGGHVAGACLEHSEKQKQAMHNAEDDSGRESQPCEVKPASFCRVSCLLLITSHRQGLAMAQHLVSSHQRNKHGVCCICV